MGASVFLTAATKRLALAGRLPAAGRHVEPSLLFPVEGAPSPRLLDVALKAIDAARSVELEWLTARSENDFAEIWPGEHYKLLMALVTVLDAKTIVEIGTFTGMSALAIKAALPQDGKLVTFDLLPWNSQPGTALREEDFADGRLEQRLDDLSTPAGWRKNAELLRSAEFVFVDAKHDGVQELAFLRGFDEIGLTKGPIVMFDDIRLWKMMAFWRGIARPKLDLTSFGHWSGTGLVDYA